MNEHSNSLLSQILAEQVKQTELLQIQTDLLHRMAEQQVTLIEALADSEQDDQEAELTTYMDGTPILGCS
ncbi:MULTISPECIES: hypothetical protein [Pseudomonas syringae group]|uniref:Uncharacterized protein n=2 Tax=Pseudomonas syringae group TaxID=136849 RepID=A0AAW4E132_PSESX|nr:MULTISPECIES: hypothetical protein [Pseudomonas syringae group]EEB58308.1 hypothetical protein PSPTOT1_4047 [Pseudomonas syringae pv. tomato T1]KGK93437.1 hypothetical protein NB04_21830 [Pseudomonas syringae pv. tomato]KUR44631.1 hypothetical protein PSTA9_02558 [Pseudomonas syringae pv. tomato]KUR47015.1 hypothetical protein PST407_02919 [Pseudomonas syringae pv. tomato]MBI6699637.1 hypothetical protein [Pseudomonas syringae]